MTRQKPRAARLFSYVVDHDLGFAPNPYSGYCTPVLCKFGGNGGRRNIVELADVGDWIVGTGGQNEDSAGNGRLIYLMRVDEKLQFRRFLADRRFHGRSDCKDFGSGNTFALISQRYFYFGRNALRVSTLPKQLAGNLEKKGPVFRRDYPSDRLRELAKWFARNHKIGMRGDPCGQAPRKAALEPDLC